MKIPQKKEAKKKNGCNGKYHVATWTGDQAKLPNSIKCGCGQRTVLLGH